MNVLLFLKYYIIFFFITLNLIIYILSLKIVNKIVLYDILIYVYLWSSYTTIDQNKIAFHKYIYILKKKGIFLDKHL